MLASGITSNSHTSLPYPFSTNIRIFHEMWVRLFSMMNSCTKDENTVNIKRLILLLVVFTAYFYGYRTSFLNINGKFRNMSLPSVSSFLK